MALGMNNRMMAVEDNGPRRKRPEEENVSLDSIVETTPYQQRLSDIRNGVNTAKPANYSLQASPEETSTARHYEPTGGMSLPPSYRKFYEDQEEPEEEQPFNEIIEAPERPQVPSYEEAMRQSQQMSAEDIAAQRRQDEQNASALDNLRIRNQAAQQEEAEGTAPVPETPAETYDAWEKFIEQQEQAQDANDELFSQSVNQPEQSALGGTNIASNAPYDFTRYQDYLGRGYSEVSAKEAAQRDYATSNGSGPNSSGTNTPTYLTNGPVLSGNDPMAQFADLFEVPEQTEQPWNIPNTTVSQEAQDIANARRNGYEPDRDIARYAAQVWNGMQTPAAPSTTQPTIESIGMQNSRENPRSNNNAVSIDDPLIQNDPEFKQIRDNLRSVEGVEVPIGILDITFYRDDLSKLDAHPVVNGTHIPFDVNNKKIVLVDDVLYTGRTVRSAIDAIFDMGRPAAIELAILIDRGHRELPFKADFTGKNVPTSKHELISVQFAEVDGQNQVLLCEEVKE